MTYITRIQKYITGFKPETHWKIIMTVTFFLLCTGIIYDVYVYIYGTRQIDETAVAVVNQARATTTIDLNMEELFDMYERRQVLYTGIIQTLSTQNVTPSALATTSTTTKTSLVATSSKQ